MIFFVGDVLLKGITNQVRLTVQLGFMIYIVQYCV